ncbi:MULTISPECIES: alpha-glucan family phosphorylase [unclassified Nitratiruptor]|uniref:alpha-glucan family phosphorylase n=1 Tax=unclassified Nitratiruptor TaxID=2624044 RepID=UPI001914E341|nr:MULTISPECIES: alpha-glucan family phosphorylase [unclassified Nitratiruptor]BCD60336.1 glycogen phosphorylase [Nitratiruptor sp. YY08-10]BCD64175.1 glycogen phosphorylase [Nitratiruptor sp. YY08-14]
MNDPARSIRIPNLPKELEGLQEIALNLWWSWNARARRLFRTIDPYRWKESVHNPIKLLRSLSKKEYEKLLLNKDFLKEYHYVYALFKQYMQPSSCKDSKTVAYFCAEYGLHRSLPIYSGGLGFLAGDILKEASDMNLSMVGIGFMYPGGYVHQVIGSDGWQKGENETIEKEIAPIEKVLDEKGNHLTIQVPLITPAVYVSVWRVNVGRVSLYLLDTDIDQNDPWDRMISYRLYTSDMHQRLRQQIVLGIGGHAVLERLGIEFSILHLNEGHPAFALFERLRYFVENKNLKFNDAVEKVKKSSIFTTHTPLMAATDVYGFDMVGKYFGEYAKKLDIDINDLLSFGIDPANPSNGFNMTVLALKLCEYKNGVSKKHQQVASKIWQQVLKEQNSKIDAITNGVHLSTWIDGDLEKELDRTLGSEWLDFQDDPDIWFKVDDIDEKFLWQMHIQNKYDLFNFIKEKGRKKWAGGTTDPMVLLAEGVMLDPEVLTIGFARRMTEYKRPDLILYDLDRLEKIVNDPSKPMQIIFAGKAHPADIPGKKIIQKIFNVAKNPKFQGRIAFIEDYGEELAKYMVKGCDIWLNNPKLPLEACGTSGMKASINGVLHCSTKDGWWLEGFNGKNGWAFGVDPSDDLKDANELYDLLENEIVPLYYDQDENGIPSSWTKMMKEAIKSVAPHFSARRMMKEYKNRFYERIGEK